MPHRCAPVGLLSVRLMPGLYVNYEDSDSLTDVDLGKEASLQMVHQYVANFTGYHWDVCVMSSEWIKHTVPWTTFRLCYVV